VVEYLESEKADAFAERDNLAFGRVQFERQTFHECFDADKILFEDFFVFVKDDEIVDVAQIMLGVEGVFDELVEFVEIDVGEELARPVPEGHSFAWFFRRIMFEYCFDEPEDVLVIDTFAENAQQDVVIDCLKIVFDVAFQRVASNVIVVSSFDSERTVPEAKKMRELAKNRDNTVVLFEIGGTYELGNAVKNDPNIHYYQVHNKEQMLQHGLEVLLAK
jgi:hypothetical protein